MCQSGILLMTRHVHTVPIVSNIKVLGADRHDSRRLTPCEPGLTDSSYKTSASPIIEKLGWLTVNDLIETETLKMVYNSKNQLAPEHLNSMFIKFSEFRNRQLRDSDIDLYVPLLKSACGQKSFSYRGAKLWNSQQTEVKKAKSLTQFVKLLKNHRP